VLTALSIRDVVLIDTLELEFGLGLGVLTGETGAGKSILLDALGLALGTRADSNLVRAGQSQATVSVTFESAADHPALALLDGPESTHLPRVHCYFDDLAAGDQSCMNRYVGEYLAIDEFNAAHRDRKICPIEQLRINRPSYEQWQERMYAFHNFSHAKYTQVVIRGASHTTELPL